MGNFYRDVIQKSPKLRSRRRVADLNLLEPVTRKRVRAIIADAKQHGLKLMVFETYRSESRQTDLFNNGATKLKKVGVHHYGLACDLVRDINGEPSWNGDFSLLGTLARHHGLIWGGDWGKPNIPHSFIDSVHVQRCTLERQADLFRGKFYPAASYNPYTDG
jgi:D-alanyl-D-alanine carboxypeptidase